MVIPHGKEPNAIMIFVLFLQEKKHKQAFSSSSTPPKQRRKPKNEQRFDGFVTHSLTIQEPHIDRILQHLKTIEIRKTVTKFPKRFALVRSGGKVDADGWISASIEGVATVYACEQLTLERFDELKDQHMASDFITTFDDDTTVYYGWFLKDVVALETPLPFKRKFGGVIWSRLQKSTTLKLADLLSVE
jgi:hypothetical protein